MAESPLHGFLKKVGVAFLLNQGCFLVDTEVPLGRLGSSHELDGHHVIDACGVGERFFRPRERSLSDFLGVRRDYEVKRNVLRGVEVKVSRSDFRNGFICSCCNFNYLLTPMRLVAPWEVPSGVGLIEYNRHKFTVEQDGEEGFRFRGLRVVRKAAYRGLRQHQIDNATARIARSSSRMSVSALESELRRMHSDIQG
jgi:hypothetical protein